MSIREYACEGYVVPLDAIASKLSPDDCKILMAAVELEDPEEIANILQELAPDLSPAFEMYRPSDTDTVDDMQEGEWYLVFDRDDLYKKIPTPELKKLRKMGIDPVHQKWCVWG